MAEPCGVPSGDAGLSCCGKLGALLAVLLAAGDGFGYLLLYAVLD